ncbi:MAG: cbb3-type cytochrome c oxidase subunit 3 [Nitrospirota bacterium]|nr:cbb3-type cytochrome c oxidase subunit 3 [Nitrospirota bacterium]
MLLNAWLKFAFTAVLSITLVVIIIHYYWPKRKEDADRVELPKYRMLDDDDHEASR